MNKDLTIGSPIKTIWIYALPLLLSGIIQQLYNIADSFIAGNLLSKEALSAVGVSSPVVNIFFSIAFGINIGGSVVVATYFGKKEFKNLKIAVSTSIIAMAVFSFILLIFGSVFYKQILYWVNTPKDLFFDAGFYLKIYVWAIPFLFLYNICTGIFTAMGDSRTPLYFLVGSSIGSIILKFLFAKYTNLGIASLAWSTFIAEGASALLTLSFLLMRLKKMPTIAFKLFSVKMLGTISKVAIPSIFQQSFITLGNMLIQVLINGFGSNIIAGYSVAVRISSFAVTTLSAFGSTMSGFTAQNLGANNITRVKYGYKLCLLFMFILSVPFVLTYTIFGEQIMKLFIDNEPEVIKIGADFLRIVPPFYFAVSIKMLTDGVLQGSKSMTFYMIVTFFDLGLRVLLAYLVVDKLGFIGVWWTWPVGWSMAAALALVFYLSGLWLKNFQKAKKLEEQQKAVTE